MGCGISRRCFDFGWNSDIRFQKIQKICLCVSNYDPPIDPILKSIPLLILKL